MIIKEILRKLSITLHLDLTKNLKYDRLTNQIMKQVIRKDSNCIDIGCHKGEMLEKMIQLAPEGTHFAFEPIPELFQKLKNHFGDQVTVYPYALSDHSGFSTFQFVKNAPAYSGLKIRKYAIDEPNIEEIQVEIKQLDEIVQEKTPIHFIKIDVEGGEFAVLKGAKELLLRDAPIVVFECGLGASDFYNTDPKELYEFIQGVHLHIYTLQKFVNKESFLTQKEFLDMYSNNSEYYFILSK
jgi:FkbM family methyltransferase